mmetsp:Transcript_149724/g.264289  ORF Transcript_149724/g.264289 Transcript_149724/m.264289 type:complete len:295 (-) Transcript_149724:40-924(-)
MSFADTLEGKDPITAVNQFCQRHCARPISKDDIVYTEAVFPPRQYQCTVKLNCIDSLEFAGELCSNKKDAKNSAAQQVLKHFSNQLEMMPATSKNTASNKKSKLKRAASTSPLALTDAKIAKVDVSTPEPSWKGELNQYFSKIVRRVIGKGEVIYNAGPVQGGFQATVKIPGLPDHWGTEIWAGEVCEKKGDAETSVAKVALDDIKADPKLMAAYTQPPKQNTWLANGGLQRQRERERAKASGRGSEPSSAAPQPSFASGGMDPTVQTLAALGYYGNYNAPPPSYVPGMPMGFS